MKRITFMILMLTFTGISVSYAGGLNPAKALKSFTKTKSKLDGLTAKYKPYKDLAINNAGMLSPELQKNMRDLDTQVGSLSKKLDMFSGASSADQVAMASSFSDDFKSLKKATNGVTKSIKGLKLPDMPKMPKM